MTIGRDRCRPARASRTAVGPRRRLGLKLATGGATAVAAAFLVLGPAATQAGAATLRGGPAAASPTRVPSPAVPTKPAVPTNTVPAKAAVPAASRLQAPAAKASAAAASRAVLAAGPTPGFAVHPSCDSATGKAIGFVYISNPTGSSQTFEVTINGGAPTALVVPSGQTKTIVLGFNSASPATFAVSDAAIGFSATRVVPAYTCAGGPVVPVVSLTASCDTTTGVATAHLTVSNPSTTSQSFVVTVNGGTPSTLVVAAGGVGTVNQSFSPASPPTFVVTDAALTFSATKSITGFTCAGPPPVVPVVAITATCDTASGVSTAHIAVTNPATTSQSFAIAAGSGTPVNLVVAPGATGTLNQTFNPGSPPTYTITDAALGFTTTKLIPTGFTCVQGTVLTPPPVVTPPAVVPPATPVTPAVAPAEVEATQQLPVTGSDPLSLLAIAAGLLVLGALALRLSTWRGPVPAAWAGPLRRQGGGAAGYSPRHFRQDNHGSDRMPPTGNGPP